MPDTGGTWLLPRLVGNARAMGLALLGDKLPEEEAARIGLIWQCVDDAALSEAAAALAAVYGMDLYSAPANEAALQSTLGTAPDYLEGVDAFRQKRAPRFTER